MPEDWGALELHLSSWAQLGGEKCGAGGRKPIEAFESLKLVCTAECSPEVPKEVVTQETGVLALCRRQAGDRPPKLCCVSKVGTCAQLALSCVRGGPASAEEVPRHLECVGKCGGLNSGLCMQSRRGVFTSFSRNSSPASWLPFSRKKLTQPLSQHALLVSPRQSHRTSLLRSGPWPGQVPVTRPVLWLLTLLVSGPHPVAPTSPHAQPGFSPIPDTNPAVSG